MSAKLVFFLVKKFEKGKKGRAVEKLGAAMRK